MCPSLKYEIAGLVLVLVLEAWLGKTEKTNAGSTLEMLYLFIKILARRKK